MTAPLPQRVGRSGDRGAGSSVPSPAGSRALRYLGALAIVAVGAIHLDGYAGANYSSIPTIGPLFPANAISCAVVAVLLLVGDFALPALAGIAIAAGSLIALFISESIGLFGFMEAGYRTVVVLSIVAEAAAIVFLGGYLALRRTAPRVHAADGSAPRRDRRGWW